MEDNNKIKIVLACEIFPPDIGGPATYAFDFMEWIRGKEGKDHRQVTAVTFGAGQSMTDVTMVGRSGGLMARNSRYFFTLFRAAQNADVIYAMGPLVSGFCAVIIGALLRKKVVIRVPGDRAWETAVMRGSKESFEEFQARWHGGMVGLMERVQIWTLKRSSAIIAQSLMWARILNDWGIVRERIKVVPNPHAFPVTIDNEGFDQRVDIISIGRLVPWKRFDDLIKAFALIFHEIAASKLILVGSGPEEIYLKTLAGNLACADRIEFYRVPNKYALTEWWSRAAVFVLPSGYEGFSNSILESWSSGVPVIASDIEGNRELIQDGKNGIFFKYGDQKSLANALRIVLADHKMRRQLAENGRKELSRFHKDKIFQEVYTILI